jgi:hypothetical protein
VSSPSASLRYDFFADAAFPTPLRTPSTIRSAIVVFRKNAWSESDTADQRECAAQG